MLDAIISADHQLFMFLNGYFTFHFLDWLMPVLTNLKNWIPLIVLTLMYLFIAGDRKMRFLGLALLLSIGLSDVICARIIKKTVGRQRPCSLEQNENFKCRLLLPKKSSKSFPSNHAANTAALAATIAFFLGFKAGLPFIFLAFLIGYSRIYCGVHFPADVLAGWLFGALAGYISAKLVQKKFLTENTPDISENSPKDTKAH